MTTRYTVLRAERPGAEHEELAVEVLVGLSDNPKRLPSRLFYDDEGSRLFQQITDLDEYYLTRLEFEVFRDHGASLLAPARGQPLRLVDLGAGDGRKTTVLIELLLAAQVELTYSPLDISLSAMEGVTDTMAERFEGLPIEGVVGEYIEGLRWLGRQTNERKLVTLLGSNIGNFSPPQARGFLRQLWYALEPGDLVLIGFDLKKDIDALLAAYNDSGGVTKAFNINLLRRINRELGADFDLEGFRHYGTYNADRGAMESFLVSKRRQEVYIRELRASFQFEPFEPIHTEYSYKYLESDIESLAQFSGFEVLERHFDSKRWFCDALWMVNKD